MLHRNLQSKLEKALKLKRSPVVLLTGARQTGKNTLMKHIAQDHDYTFMSFDDVQTLGMTRNQHIMIVDATMHADQEAVFNRARIRSKRSMGYQPSSSKVWNK